MATNNTLIVYASRHGNVEKCARELFTALDGKVDICNLNNRKLFPDISTYDSIIIGGSIYYGKVQKSVSDFCNINFDVLIQKRLGLFISCLYADEKAEKELRESFPPELHKHATVSDYFGGEIDKSKLSFLEKILVNQMIKSGELILSISQEKIKQFAEKMNPSHADKE
ncbi:MAG: flavodoxin domain-containing protein [Bacteroidia bacterium]|nr:flavodoxin domain-containing protein [Bacteroidia bacterium]